MSAFVLIHTVATSVTEHVLQYISLMSCFSRCSSAAAAIMQTTSLHSALFMLPPSSFLSLPETRVALDTVSDPDLNSPFHFRPYPTSADFGTRYEARFTHCFKHTSAYFSTDVV